MDEKEEIVKIVSTAWDASIIRWAQYDEETVEKLKKKGLEYIKSMIEGMAVEIEIDTQETEALWSKIRQLWKRLKTEKNVTAHFEELVSLMTPSCTLQALKKELDRCEEEKKANTKSFIMELRVELKEIWGKCLVSPAYQDGFFPILSSDYSLELLEAHEQEYEKWKDFYSSNEQMIGSIHTYEAAWLTLKEHQSTEKDSSRLLNNRGARLLEQEKDKKAAMSTLKQTEALIRELDVKFRDENGRNFSVRGKAVLDYIQDESALSDLPKDLKGTKMRKSSIKRGHLSSSQILPSGAKRCKISFIPRLIRSSRSHQVLRGLNTTEVLRRRSAKLRDARLTTSSRSSKNAQSAVKSQVGPRPSTFNKIQQN